MTLRLNGSTSGYVEIDAPATAGSNSIVLPSGNGSANQFLKNGSTAGTLGWSSMVETATGVGIGTTSPSTKLQVDGSWVNNYGTLNITGPDNDLIGIGFRNTSTNVGGVFFRDGTAGDFLELNAVGSRAIRALNNGTERMRINSDGGIVGGGNTATYNLTASPGFSFSPGTAAGSFNGLSLNKSASNWGTALYIHRTFGVGDGTLIEFAHDTVTEGNISVSGTTVSYNGGHLSRWSQTINSNEPDALLKGTVMTNLDEMCEWFKEDGTLEDNEQLNKMAVSSVEGDPNVAGVLVSVDDDGDLNVGMTGDMVIRIADGVTVQRGDLLMSAGDGTAKPQDDDIIRSKTIAKVTSTHVSETYADGSYCVPCVLMAC